VLHSALAHLAANAALPCVTVNVSSRQVLHDDLPNVVARGLERHGVSPDRLIVEITESALLPDSGRVRMQMRDLRKLGVRVALDAKQRAMACKRTAPLEHPPDMGCSSGQIFQPLWMATSPPIIGSTRVRTKPASRIIPSNLDMSGKRRIDSIR